MELMQIERALVQPNPDQPRKDFDPEALQELADSIRENGLLQPVTVRPTSDGKYSIIAGERRYRALCLNEAETIPCVVLTGVSDERSFILATTENVARRDMNVIEEANAYQQIMALGKSLDETARLFGKSRVYIENHIALLSLRDDFQRLVAKGQLSYNVALSMSRLSTDGQSEVARKLTAGEFPTDPDAVRYAAAVQKREAQPALLGPLFGEPISEEEVQKRRRNREVVDNVFDRLAKLAEALEPLNDLTAEEIVAVYGPKTVYAQDQMVKVFIKVHRAQNRIKDALALYEAAQEETVA